MNKITIPVFVIFSIFIVSDISLAKNKLPLITEIGFLNPKTNELLIPPKQICLFINITNNANYRLLYNDRIIASGLLNEGSNVVSLPGKDLLKSTARHIFLLDTKSSHYRFQKELTIDTKLNTENQNLLTEKKIKTFQFSTAMFVGNQLIIKSRKMVFRVADRAAARVSRIMNEGPNNLVDEKLFSQISLLQIISKLLKKKKKLAIPKPKEICITFLKKDAAGNEIKIKVMIKMMIRDVNIGKNLN